ncbi:metallophosphoesterase [Sulfitobacter sp. HNIBRBA3233]|uniref:metallophosphoesterase family protein n=1 Tax=Sulfitobacter marinivivus TaxID=3158558 RepID=UPI0032DF6E92
MTRLVHLSDLHFGKDRPDLLQPLTDAVNDLSPDLVVISGDLTQRAREREYRAAARFIDGLASPVLSVPGNHDIPIHRPFRRFFRPWGSYRKMIAPDLTPRFETDEAIVIGINTVDRFRWQTGRMSRGRIRHACAAMGDSAGDRARILVAHHPLEHPKRTKKKPIPGAQQALHQLLGCGADMILSGHLHVWHTGTFAHTTTREYGKAIQIHAGTSLSSRVRGEPNDFNLIEISQEHFDITRISYEDETTGFQRAEARRFDRASGMFVNA